MNLKIQFYDQNQIKPIAESLNLPESLVSQYNNVVVSEDAYCFMLLKIEQSANDSHVMYVRDIYLVNQHFKEKNWNQILSFYADILNTVYVALTQRQSNYVFDFTGPAYSYYSILLNHL